MVNIMSNGEKELYIGAYPTSIDSKGRIYVPPQFRGFFTNPNELILELENPEWNGSSTALCIYKNDSEKKSSKKLRFSGLKKLDNEGRYLPPEIAREIASMDIREKFVMVGYGDKLKVALRDKFVEYQKTRLSK
jgi:DNA-binding transcriptional regulator/RsmH inhibitor MraZ